MQYKDNASADAYVIKDSEKIPYSGLVKEVEQNKKEMTLGSLFPDSGGKISKLISCENNYQLEFLIQSLIYSEIFRYC